MPKPIIADDKPIAITLEKGKEFVLNVLLDKRSYSIALTTSAAVSCNPCQPTILL